MGDRGGNVGSIAFECMNAWNVASGGFKIWTLVLAGLAERNAAKRLTSAGVLFDFCEKYAITATSLRGIIMAFQSLPNRVSIARLQSATGIESMRTHHG